MYSLYIHAFSHVYLSNTRLPQWTVGSLRTGTLSFLFGVLYPDGVWPSVGTQYIPGKCMTCLLWETFSSFEHFVLMLNCAVDLISLGGQLRMIAAHLPNTCLLPSLIPYPELRSAWGSHPVLPLGGGGREGEGGSSPYLFYVFGFGVNIYHAHCSVTSLAPTHPNFLSPKIKHCPNSLGPHFNLVG